MATAAKVDFKDHAESAANDFALLRPKFDSLATEIHRVLSDAFQPADRNCKVHKVEFRAKSIESFRVKCKKTIADGSPKYTDPFSTDPRKGITDLAAVRVILFFPQDLNKVCAFIDEHFDRVEKRDVGEERFATSGSFGYASIHYLVKLKEEWLKLPQYSKYRDMICEIQVRTILQHAWAEMEHDIQYKSEQSLPVEIRRKFTALAGMLEIADREFQSIQREDERLHSVIRKSLEEQLTLEIIPEQPLPVPDQSTESPLAVAAESAVPRTTVRARDLVISGDFARAVEEYSKRISDQPNAHTLYLGRARARFLAGDRDGALKDITKASELNPEDAAISIARDQFESGNVPPPATNYDRAALSLRLANEALSKGEGKAAFVHFSDAQRAGHNYAFSLFNMAMSLAFVRDTTGARQLLSELRPTPTTPMEINAVALRAILNEIDSKAIDDDLGLLQEKMNLMPDFTFQLSPLRYFEQGLTALQKDVPDQIAKVFSLLKKKSK